MPSLNQLQSAFGKFRRLVTENRYGQRKPSDAQVAVSWRDGRGRITHARAHCMEISEVGARIAYGEPIVLPAILQMRSEADGRIWTGRVRHCTPKGTQYEIGIEFCDPAEIQAAMKQHATR